MTQSPNVRIPTWATDATVSPGYIDAGLSVRVEPSEAAKGQGYVGGQPIPAETDNWLIGGLADWVKWLAPLQLRSWRKTLSDPLYYDTFTKMVLAGQPACIARGNWLLPGSIYSGAGQTCVGWTWPSPVNANGQLGQGASSLLVDVQTFTSAAVIGDTVVYGLGQNVATHSEIVYGSVTTGSLIKVSIGTPVGYGIRVFTDGSTFYAFGVDYEWQNGHKYWTSTNGSTWTERTVAGVTGTQGQVTGLAIGSSGRVVVSLGNSGASAEFAYSDDHGISWTTVDMTANETGFNGVCWSNGRFLFKGLAGGIYSWDGTSRVHLSSVLYSFSGEGHLDNNVGAIFYGSQLASDGGLNVVCTTYVSGIGVGIAYSQDGGETWSYDWLTRTRSSSYECRPVGLVYGQGEYLLTVLAPDALDSGRIFDIWQTTRV